MKFRKKPVVIDAVQWTGDNLDEIRAFCPIVMHDPVSGLSIPTLEGVHGSTPGDFIIRGVKGEYYPCKPDIFALTYEADVGVRCDCPMCEHHTSAREHAGHPGHRG